MIANNNLKLGQLALVQESMKGFPQGIPEIAMPYIEHLQMNPEEFMPQQGAQEQPMMAANGAEMARRFPGLNVAGVSGSSCTENNPPCEKLMAKNYLVYPSIMMENSVGTVVARQFLEAFDIYFASPVS